MDILSLIFSILMIVCAGMALSFYSQKQKVLSEQKQREEAQKDQFYEIVHELRAPLTAVKDAASLLQSMHESLPAEEQKKLLSVIKTQCITLLDQVTGVLDASKVMSKKITLEKTPNDLTKLIKEKIIMFTPQAQTAEIELASEFDPLITEVLYDPHYMNQVMNNLLSNSLKYTPKGGRITVTEKAVDNAVEIAVFDNGLGVATEAQKQLFAKFNTLNHDTKKMSSGLGLYVVKGIIEAHGGNVRVETQENRGYKVVISLPFTSLPASLISKTAAK